MQRGKYTSCQACLARQIYVCVCVYVSVLALIIAVQPNLALAHQITIARIILHYSKAQARTNNFTLWKESDFACI